MRWRPRRTEPSPVPRRRRWDRTRTLVRTAARGVWRAGRRVPGAAVVWIVAVVLSFIAFGTSDTVYDAGILGWGVMPFIGALVGLPFGLVATRPMPGWAFSTGSAALLAVVLPRHPGTPWPWLVVQGLVIFALLFGVSVRGAWRNVVGAWLGTAALFAWGVPSDQVAGWMVAVTSVTLVGLLAGRLVSTNVALARQTRDTADEKARRTVLEERTRIARDLHDIVAHHMSLIVVQAETAQFRRPDLTSGAREELEAISAAAREALSETRALLTVLRRDDEQAAYAPQPGVEQIEELCRTALRAGVPVEWRIDLPPDGVRRATSLAAYRIAQEALANAARHAPSAAVSVVVVGAGDEVQVTVENGPPPGGPTATATASAAGAGAGHGIVGMREHAVAEGGRLDVGPTPGGGYRVEAVLPSRSGATAVP